MTAKPRELMTETKTIASCSDKVADDDQSVRNIRRTLRLGGRE